MSWNFNVLIDGEIEERWAVSKGTTSGSRPVTVLEDEDGTQYVPVHNNPQLFVIAPATLPVVAEETEPSHEPQPVGLNDGWEGTDRSNTQVATAAEVGDEGSPMTVDTAFDNDNDPED